MCRGTRGRAVRVFEREIRVEHEPDVEPFDDVLGAADVVPRRVCHDERVEAANTHPVKLLCDASFGRPLIDENGTAWDLDQRRIALAHVEKCDAKARDRTRGRFVAGRPEAPRSDKRQRHRRERESPPPAMAAKLQDDGRNQGHQDEEGDGAR
jgi:hypothetical protein